VLAKQITAVICRYFVDLMSIQHLYHRLILIGLFTNKKWMIFEPQCVALHRLLRGPGLTADWRYCSTSAHADLWSGSMDWFRPKMWGSTDHWL